MLFSRLIVSTTVLFSIGAAQGAGVKARFDPSTPEIGPFPTDYLTAPATNTVTARRVQLPRPDCGSRPNDCFETDLVNQLDGFSPQARARITFSGPIDPDTLRAGVFYVGLGPAPTMVRINRVVYDPATNTAYAKPDTSLDQSRTYALVITDAVKDRGGDPVEADDAFAACAGASPPDDYCKALSDALKTITVDGNVVGASLFTTLSATAFMERARDQLAGVDPAVQPISPKSVFNFSEIASIVWRQQRSNASQLTDFDLSLASFVLGQAHSKVAFGTYRSPNYLDNVQTIPYTPSAVDPTAISTSEIAFQAYYPRRERPAKGYPVVIFGHGLGDNRFLGPTALALSFGPNGMATIAINAVGHGYGPASRLMVRENGGAVYDLPAPGRGVDVNRTGSLGPEAGCLVVIPASINLRDCLRQTAIDLMQLVRVIRAGLDLDGDGQPDFDPDQIYYAGQSLGAMYGTVFMALEPSVKTAVLNAGGGSVVDIIRWSPGFHAGFARLLALRLPSLNNAGADYNENYVLRDQPAKVNDVNGAIPIQDLFERLEWIQSPGDPLSFATHLKTFPLTGVSAKTILWQFAIGDQTVPNPTESALVRAADMRESTWVYRHDLTRQVAPLLDPNPHTYLTNGLLAIAWSPISDATTMQMAVFLATAGATVLDPNVSVRGLYGGDIFEVPATLPEDLNFQKANPNPN
jgi:Bacterial Ig-like domain